jgi:hypothetical protein
MEEIRAHVCSAALSVLPPGVLFKSNNKTKELGNGTLIIWLNSTAYSIPPSSIPSITRTYVLFIRQNISRALTLTNLNHTFKL